LSTARAISSAMGLSLDDFYSRYQVPRRPRAVCLPRAEAS